MTTADEGLRKPVEWPAARSAGHERLKVFLPYAGRAYASQRNYDFGPCDRSNVSALSPWIRHRLIGESEVLASTLQRYRLSTAEKFVQEVFWRSYFKGWLEHRPQVWSRYCDELDKQIAVLNCDGSLEARYSEAVQGRTGIDCFDAWASELIETGYLHNHARMWFASIWIFTLRLPWQLGADFFYRHLLDGDPASNTLSWRWVGGLHTKGKHYLARASNIQKYTDGRFHPTGQLAENAEALSEPARDELRPLPPQDPIAGDEPFGLLITEEDGWPESLDLPGGPVSVLGLTMTEDRSPLTVGDQALSFAENAMQDTLDRASRHFGCETVQANGPDWRSSLSGWARQHGLRKIVTAYAPVGPVAQRLSAVTHDLEAAGIRLVQTRRPFDEICWPHATKGFFALKKKIPGILASLDIVQTA